MTMTDTAARSDGLAEQVTVDAARVLHAEGYVYRYRVASASGVGTSDAAVRGCSQLVAFEWLTDVFGLSSGVAREALRMAEVFGSGALHVTWLLQGWRWI